MAHCSLMTVVPATSATGRRMTAVGSSTIITLMEIACTLNNPAGLFISYLNQHHKIMRTEDKIEAAVWYALIVISIGITAYAIIDMIAGM